MKIQSGIFRVINPREASVWLLKIIKQSAIIKNVLKMIFPTILSIGLFGFCLGFYLKMYMMLSLPSFALMVLAAFLFDG